MSEFNQGLIISIVGLLITFTALGVFILVMVVLKKLFPFKEQKNEKGEAEDEETYEDETTLSLAENTSSEEEEIAAAIGAITILRSQQSNQLGATLLEGPGRYWAAKNQSKK